MEVDQAVCSGSDCPHPPSLWGAALPLDRGRGGESALQSKMGAASRHHPLAAGAGWARVIWSERWCTVVLACGTVPYLSIFPALVSSAFAEGRGSFFSCIPTPTVVSCWQGSYELVWDGQPGPLTVVHPLC